MIGISKVDIIAETEDWIAVNRTISGKFLLNKYSIYNLDPELTGVLLFSKNKESYTILRNLYGSQKFTFTFTIIGLNNLKLEKYIYCDLPIAQHSWESGMIISHKTGKKCQTEFEKLETIKSYAIWQAETNFLRKHQIRLHAHECKIDILGEDYYSSVKVPSIYDFKFKVKYNRKGEPLKLYNSICIHLSKISFEYLGEKYEIEGLFPGKLSGMLKVIKKWS